MVSPVSADGEAPHVGLVVRIAVLHRLIIGGAVDAGPIPARGGIWQATRGQQVQFLHRGRHALG